MKPTFTCNVVRELAAALGVNAIVTASASVEIDWKRSGTIEHVRRRYLLNEITRKMTEEASSKVLRDRALETFLATEHENRWRNNRIVAGEGLTNDLILRLVRARGIIKLIIGETPPISVLEGCHFSGGASTSRTRRTSFTELKYVPTWDSLNCSERALPFWKLASRMNMYAYETAAECDVIRGVVINNTSTWSSVPKDALTERSIIIGNDANTYLQRGAGVFIGDSLRRFGIDLTDQSLNRALAARASQCGTLTTHDAVDSSNRIVLEAVRLLLGDGWFRYLDAISERECVLPDGSIHKLELFSSMGNGFTFELQSLIYFALALASQPLPIREAKRDIGVFGDDVILRTTSYPKFLELIHFLGMEGNQKKSYSVGFFRESCGGHFLHGRDISPFYIRHPLDKSKPETVYKLVNELRLWYYGNYHDSWDPAIERVIKRVATFLPKWQRNCVPEFEDPTSGFFSPVDGTPVRFIKSKRTGQERLVYNVWTETTVRRHLPSDCELPWYLVALWGRRDLEGARWLTVTQAQRRLRKRSVGVGRVGWG